MRQRSELRPDAADHPRPSLADAASSPHDPCGSASWTGAGPGLQSRWCSARAAARRVRFPCASA